MLVGQWVTVDVVVCLLVLAGASPCASRSISQCGFCFVVVVFVVVVVVVNVGGGIAIRSAQRLNVHY